jgi:hypothetical protein
MSYPRISTAPSMSELEALAEAGDYEEVMMTERARVYEGTDRFGNRYLCRNMFAFYNAELRRFERPFPVKIEEAEPQRTRRLGKRRFGDE